MALHLEKILSMKSPLIYVVLMALLLSLENLVASEVPRQFEYCGMEVELTEGAQRKVQEYVDDILKGPRYFNEMVMRAHTYMPFIEEALNEAGVPDDLKYLAIQESALRPDVVSSSQAVGFWQFKEETARDFGLRVNDKVDERMHIYRASEGAAKYLKRANGDFDNWVFAVMAYFHGFTGAIPYTDPKYYGAKRMVVTEDLHWYPLKAMAHKLAYEEAVNLRQRPLVALIPYSTYGESIVKRLLEGHQAVDEETFFLYNKWIRDPRRLPKGELFTYYVPQPAEFYTGHINDPTKDQIASAPGFGRSTRNVVGNMDDFVVRPPVYAPQEVPDRPFPAAGSGERVAQPIGTMAGAFRAANPSEMVESQYVIFNLIYDLNYGKDYVIYNGRIGLPELAERLKVRLAQFLVWNDLTPGQRPQAGAILYMENPKKVGFHVVEEGESIESIGKRHKVSPRKIAKKNRLDSKKPTIYIGQKLYLKDKRPKDEKVIILQYELAQPVAQVESAPTGPPTTREVSPAPTISTTPGSTASTSQPSPEGATKWITHEVQPGDNLWQIAQRYGTRVEIIKRSNELTSDHLQVGQTLKILSKVQN